MNIYANKKASTSTFTSYANYSALVADEFENSRQSVKKMLATLGIGTIDQTATGKGVLEACRARKYDLILCDFRLGAGKNGLQVLDELRQLNLLKSSAFFVIISAETSRDIVFGIMESSPDDYLGKPFTEGVLGKRLERLFAQNIELEGIKKAAANKDYNSVITLCNEHIKHEGRYAPWCKRALIDAYLGKSDWGKLKQLCDEVISQREIDWAMLGILRMYVAQEEWNKAIKSGQELVKKFPQCIQAYDLLALSLMKTEQAVKAQEVLESALKISPLRHERQQKMVDVSLENGDAQAAVKASQQTLKLVTNTINESPEKYFQLADILSEASTELEGSEKQRMAKEALSILNKVSKKYINDHEIRINKALSESRVYALQGHDALRDEALASAKMLIEQSPESKTTAVSIQLGKTLFLAGKEEEAKKEWQALEEGDLLTDEQSQVISDFIDEPIPIGARGRAKFINTEGLSAYAQRDFDKAIELFEEAMKISPRHPGLNMNFVQATLKKIEKGGKSRALLNICKRALDNVSHIKPNHRQYNRYQKLQNLIAKSEKML